jgi:hypothetical protein
MLDALTSVSRGQPPLCPECKDPLRLHLSFDFSFGADGRDVVVVASYLPRNSRPWDTESEHVTFLPFLIVTETAQGKRAMWLPYWHEVVKDGKKSMKYGQWAPYMDDDLFLDLLAQARADGFLTHPSSERLP